VGNHYHVSEKQLLGINQPKDSGLVKFLIKVYSYWRNSPRINKTGQTVKCTLLHLLQGCRQACIMM